MKLYSTTNYMSEKGMKFNLLLIYQQILFRISPI